MFEISPPPGSSPNHSNTQHWRDDVLFCCTPFPRWVGSHSSQRKTKRCETAFQTVRSFLLIGNVPYQKCMHPSPCTLYCLHACVQQHHVLFLLALLYQRPRTHATHRSPDRRTAGSFTAARIQYKQVFHHIIYIRKKKKKERNDSSPRHETSGGLGMGTEPPTLGRQQETKIIFKSSLLSVN